MFWSAGIPKRKDQFKLPILQLINLPSFHNISSHVSNMRFKFIIQIHRRQRQFERCTLVSDDWEEKTCKQTTGMIHRVPRYCLQKYYLSFYNHSIHLFQQKNKYNYYSGHIINVCKIRWYCGALDCIPGIPLNPLCISYIVQLAVRCILMS